MKALLIAIGLMLCAGCTGQSNWEVANAWFDAEWEKANPENRIEKTVVVTREQAIERMSQ